MEFDLLLLVLVLCVLVTMLPLAVVVYCRCRVSRAPRNDSCDGRVVVVRRPQALPEYSFLTQTGNTPYRTTTQPLVHPRPGSVTPFGSCTTPFLASTHLPSVSTPAEGRQLGPRQLSFRHSLASSFGSVSAFGRRFSLAPRLPQDADFYSSFLHDSRPSMADPSSVGASVSCTSRGSLGSSQQGSRWSALPAVMPRLLKSSSHWSVDKQASSRASCVSLPAGH